MVIKNYINFINERLGIPDGIIKNAQKLFDLIIKRLDELGDKVICKDNDIFKEKIDIIDIDFNNFKIKNIDIGFEFYPNQDDFDLLSMSVFTSFTDKDKYKLLYKKNEESKRNSIINLVYAVKTGETKYSDIKNNLLIEKEKNIGSLAHELKHMYDKYMFGKDWFHDIASYSVFSNTRFGIDPIDEFFYLLYLTNEVENLVRSTEIGAEIELLGITKKEFSDFLKNTRFYPNLKLGKEFSFENMKSNLYNYIDLIKKVFDNSDIIYKDDPDYIVDLVLDLSYINIKDGSIYKLKSMLGIGKNIFGIEINTQGISPNDYYLRKNIKKKTFKNKEDFFEYWEKYINFTSDKVFKKISKLYDMCKDENVNPLQDKISKKSENSDDKSIINPELYDKYVVDKKIKKYETFKYKK